MTSFYLISALFVAVVTGSTVFQRKKEYNYEYEGWQTIGVRQSFSIQAIRANLSLKVISDDIISFQMSHVQWARNDSYHRHDYHQDRKQVQFEEVQGLNKTLMEYPVYIHYDPEVGQIKKLIIRKEERSNVNSINLKVAAMQLLQLSHKCLAEINPQRPDWSWWNVIEDGTCGECQTNYQVTQSPQSKVRFCRKMRDYKQCSKRPEYRHLMPVVSNSSGSHDAYQTGSNQTSSTVYQLKQQESGWVIDHVQLLSSKHTYLHKSIKEPCKIWVNATLRLQSVEPLRSAHRNIPRDMSEVQTSLRYNFTIRQPDLQQPPVPNTAMPVTLDFLLSRSGSFQKIQTEILKAVWQIEQQLDPVTKISGVDIVNNTLHIQKLGSSLTKKQLEDIYQQLHTPIQKEIYLDAMTSVGTNPALYALFELIRNERVDQYTSVRLIRKVPFVLKTPTAAILQKFQELAESSVVARNPELKKTCLMAMSNVLRLVCSVEYKLSPYPTATYGPPCTSEVMSLLRRHVQRLENLIQSAPMPEKLSWLSAMASTGHKEACPPLKSIVQRDIDRHATIQVLNSLHHLPIESCSLKNLTARIYHDITRHPSERKFALISLMRMMPSRSQIHAIALSTLREPSKKVAENTQKVFMSLANISRIWSPDPAMRKLSAHARELLPLLQRPYVQNSDTYRLIYQIFPDMLSQQMELATTHPDALSLIINNFIKEVKSEKLDWFVQQRGFVDMLRPWQFVSQQMTRTQRSSPRDLSNAGRAVPQMIKVLNVKQTNPDESPFIYFAYKLLNSMDYDRMLDKLPEPSWSPLCAPGQKQQYKVYGTIPTIEESFMVPSELGLPLVTRRRSAWVYAFAANCSSSSEQNETKLHLLTEYDQYSECSTYDPFKVSVVKVSHVNKLHIQSPRVAIRTRKDQQSGRVDVQMELSQDPQDVKLLEMHSKYYISAQQDVHKFIHRRPVPSKRIASHESELPNLLGLSLKMKYSSVYRSIPRKQWKWFEPPTCDHDIYVSLNSQQSPTKKLELSLQAKNDPFTADNQGQKARFISPEHWQNIQQAELDAKREADKSLKQLQDQRSRNVSVIYAVTLQGSAKYFGSAQGVYSPVKDKSAARIVAKGREQWTCITGEYEAKPMSDDLQTLQNSPYNIPFRGQVGSGQRSCQSDIINVRGWFKSDPQKRSPPAQYHAHVEKCRDAQRRGFPSAPVCQAVKDVAAAINQIEVEVSWSKQLPLNLRNMSRRYDDMIKQKFYQYMSNDPYSPNPSNKVQLRLEADNYWNTWDAKLVKPHETTRLVQLPDIPLLSRVQLWSARRSLSQKLADFLYGPDQMMCAVDRNMSWTFDNKVYNISLPQQCRTLLLATWSPQPLQVYSRPTPRGKVVTFEVDAHVLSVEHQADQWIVHWDKRPVPQVEEWRCFPAPEYMCVRRANNEIQVKALSNCWNIWVTWEGVVLKANPVCIPDRTQGLCGNMDGEWLAEEQDREGCVHPNPHSLQKALQAPPVDGPQSSCAPVKPSPCVSERSYRHRYADQHVVDYPASWQQHWPLSVL